MASMDFVFNSLSKFDRKKTTLSDWLAQLENRFELADIEEEGKKIKLCQLYIGQTENDILEALPAETTWAAAKVALIEQLSEGSQTEEAWNALKSISRDGRDLVDLASEI